MLALHSGPEFLGKIYELVSGRSEEEVLPRDKAFLLDRTLVFKGEPQIYGTQFREGEKGAEPFPIKDPESLNQRRQEVGLEPFEIYQSNFS